MIIGCEPMDEAKIRAELDNCLVDATDFRLELWRGLPDPFPVWERRAS